MAKKVREHLHHCAKSISCVSGVVLIWYSIWWFIDYLEDLFFVGHEGWLALIAFIVGIGVLYLPDKDLNELQ